MKPNASAPAATAADASSALVMPHTFTLTCRGIALDLRRRRKPAQFADLGLGIFCLDQRFADEHGMDAEVEELLHMTARVDAALADDEFAGRNAGSQSLRHREVGRKRREIAIIDADNPGVGNPFQHPVELAF